MPVNVPPLSLSFRVSMVGRGGVLVRVIVTFHVPVGLMVGSSALIKPVKAKRPTNTGTISFFI